MSNPSDPLGSGSLGSGSLGSGSLGSGLPEVGVAVTFSAGLIETLTRYADLVDAVEIEPQSLWSEHPGSPRPYRMDPDVTDTVVDLPFRKLVHSIGLPVGGSADHDPDHVELLRATVDRLDPAFFSEHLSFNHTPEGFAGFLLPPAQTDAGVERCAASARALQDAIGRPLAIETGVNYLRPRHGDIDDGAFTAFVADSADCLVLLDLHNIYTNERNGRQSMDEFVAQLDLNRVVEVHVAGGMEMDGFWLDAHSGAMPPDLFDRASGIIAELPNLKAITFEIYPAFLSEIDDRLIGEQLEQLRALWECRGRKVTDPRHRRTVAIRPPAPAESAPEQWERELAGLVTCRSEPAESRTTALADDPGIELLQRLSLEFRASMITTNLPRTTRLLLLALGEDVVRLFLREFRAARSPRMFGATEALSFGSFLTELNVHVPQLDAVLRFEMAALRSRLDGQTRVVDFSCDPLPMLRALSEGRLPDELATAGSYEIELVGAGTPSSTLE